jgi:hypothetical protein
MKAVFCLHTQKTMAIFCLSQRNTNYRMHIFNFQTEFRPAFNAILNIKGSKDFRDQRDLFFKIDDIFNHSNLEHRFIELCALANADYYEKSSDTAKERFQNHCRLVLRGNIARIITRTSHRAFATRLADSHLLQWFLLIDRIDGVKAYAKSTSDRFAHFAPDEAIDQINTELMQQLASDSNPLTENLQLKQTIDFNNAYIDAFCLKANIHYPVDWVLLRDATRTLMKAINLIRNNGLLNRMSQSPLDFLSEINSLCMQMGNARRTKNAAKLRKKTYRLMKHLMNKISNHAQKHRDLLISRGLTETDLTQNQINQILKRINNILDQLPAAIKQAHERIIAGRKIKTSDKILSLYDSKVEVLSRGKSNAEVEFGNKLFIAELGNGLIIHHNLLEHQVSDTKLIKPTLAHITQAKLPLKALWSDRGFHSKSNTELLEQHNLTDGLCPKDPHQLKVKLTTEPGYKEGLKRRAGTEARVSILSRLFIGNPCKSKTFENRKTALSWAVFAHNLWVIARLEQTQAQAEEAEAA